MHDESGQQQRMPLRQRAGTVILAAVMAVVAVHVDGTPVSASPHRFSSLEEAVAADLLDDAVVADLRADGTADAIVTFDDHEILARAAEARANGTKPGRVVAAIRAAAGDLRRPTIRMLTEDRGAEILVDYEHLPALIVRFHSEATLLEVVSRPEVTDVHAEIPLVLNTTESAPLVRQPEAAALGHVGLGTAVAVIDTGVDYGRTAFGSCTAPGAPSGCRVLASLDIAPDDGTRDDASLHGTNVGGIVAAIAPGTKLVVLDVMRSNGTATSSVLMAAIDWVIAHAASYNVRAINISLGSGAYSSSCPPDPGFATAMAADIVPVAAAGNGGQTTGVAWPACVADAIAVGAVYDSNVGSRSYSTCSDTSTAADQITCFSQSGSNLDMLAPGAIITAAGVSMAGTSQAAPHVAAAAATLAGSQVGVSAVAVRDALVRYGRTITDPRNGVARPRLDIYAAVVGLSGGSPDGSSPPSPNPGHPFTDISDSPFEADIIWIYHAGITKGCAPDRYCPADPVRRDEMASFLDRALDLPATTRDYFADDAGNLHEAAINRVAAAGISLGCGPAVYCPAASVTREQMASFLVRALTFIGRPAPTTTTDYFTDDDASPHEADINRLAAAGITGGCGGGMFCPSDLVTREQMAAFLRRSLTR